MRGASAEDLQEVKKAIKETAGVPFIVVRQQIAEKLPDHAIRFSRNLFLTKDLRSAKIRLVQKMAGGEIYELYSQRFGNKNTESGRGLFLHSYHWSETGWKNDDF